MTTLILVCLTRLLHTANTMSREVRAMMCAGKIYCDIYRDKKYCRRDHKGDYEKCDCQHAVVQCAVGDCVFLELCPIVKERGDNG